MSQPNPAADRLELRPGARPLPDYELLAQLGKGGFGEVWKAVAPGGLKVALKFIPLDQNAGAIEQRALDLMLEVRHPHLLDLHGYWQRHGHLILAMSLADGTLLDRLAQARAEGLPGILADELLTSMEEAAEGLDFLAGKRLQHRDVKPGNLLLVGGAVKVTDFGLARVLERSVSDTKEGGYTLAYAAPELVNKQVSLKVDQYALAVTYCQLRTGQLPFTGSAQQILIGHLMHPPDLTMLPEAERAAVAGALVKNPEDRWPTCLAFVQALRRQPTAVVPPSAARQPEQAAANTLSLAQPRVETWSPRASDSQQVRPASRGRGQARRQGGPTWWWVGLTAVLLIVVVGLGVRTLLPGPESPQEPAPGPEVKAPPIQPEPRPPVLRLVALQPATVTLKPGEAQTVDARIDREHCDGAVTVEVDGLPGGVSAEAAPIAADANQGRLTLRAATAATAASALVTIHVRAGPASDNRQLLVAVRPEPKPPPVKRVPELLVAPFDVQQINQARQAWADSLGVTAEQPVDLGGGVKLELVLIPPGKFRMGSPAGEERRYTDETPHDVTLTRPFYLGKYELTQEQYQAVMGTNPSQFARVAGMDTRRFPVEDVSWEDAQTLLGKLNARNQSSGWLYRLPREAEWEYGCRGGAAFSKPFGVGEGTSLTWRGANFNWDFPYNSAEKRTYLARPQPVGTYSANGFGLYDMHGNVYEWCQDWYDSYPEGLVSDPEGPATGSTRVLRGGSWNNNAGGCRAALRLRLQPSLRQNMIGLRLALVPSGK